MVKEDHLEIPVLLCIVAIAKELGEKFLLSKRELDFGTDPKREFGG